MCIRDRPDLLTSAGERISFAIEAFVTMATHTTALREKIAAEVQSVSAVGDAISRVTLLTARLRVLFLKHGPEPEAMAPVPFHVAGSRASVAPVTTRTTEFLRIVYRENFLVWMADKCARQSVRLATGFVLSL